ncbi:MAG: aminoacyl-histidine dipeptidase [Bacteroidota bacterium]
MENTLSHILPQALWHYFGEICMIPRPSKKEEKIRQYLVDFAKKQGLACDVDEIGNVLIRKPGSPGRENDRITVLQSHMDMVCEKNQDTVHDFDIDPIRPRIDGDWVKATNTTLGADNGIGVAASLAILEDKTAAHGPLEILITVDEETGLSGAFALQPDYIKGRILLNLDSEDEGEIFIGCAGGTDTAITLPVSWEAIPAGYSAYSIEISGLKGGHSGDEIHKRLGNSNKILNRILWSLSQQIDLRIATFSGGNLRNAIPREASGTFVIPIADLEICNTITQRTSIAIWQELQHTDPDLSIKITPAPMPAQVLTKESGDRLMQSLYACPHGVIAMSPVIPGLVETSTNLAAVRTEKDHIYITTSQRSSTESAKQDIANMVSSTFKLAGAITEQGDGYPGWAPNPNSEILEITKQAHIKVLGYEPAVRAIHAGLECGVIGEKYPGIDMISFGPTIRGPHSPDERLEIATVGRFWDLLLQVLLNIR